MNWLEIKAQLSFIIEDITTDINQAWQKEFGKELEAVLQTVLNSIPTIEKISFTQYRDIINPDRRICKTGCFVGTL